MRLTATHLAPILNRKENHFFSAKNSSASLRPKSTDFFPKNQLQKKELSIGKAGDKYEVEADAVADKVVQRLANDQGNAPSFFDAVSPAPTIQHKCTECSKEEVQQKEKETLDEEVVQLRESISATGAVADGIKRKNNVSRITLQTKGDNGQSRNIASQLDSSKGAGNGLPEKTKTAMETAFGTDFSRVNIHTGSNAVQMSQAFNAQAFTHGNDIYFNKGKYRPESTEGKHLLAHELTHTIQQNSVNIQKEEDTSTNQSSSSPEKYAVDVILELIEGFQSKVETSNDNEEKAYAARTLIVLNDELNNLSIDEEGNSEAIVDKSESNMDYGIQFITELDEILSSEEKTFVFLTGNSPEFLNLMNSDAYLQNLNAFPKLTLSFILPLIKVPSEFQLGDKVETDLELEQSAAKLPEYFFEEGFPLELHLSRYLFDYRHVKKLPPKIYYFLSENRPKYTSDFEFLIEPDQSSRFSGDFLRYYTAWTNAAMATYNKYFISTWFKMSNDIKIRVERGNFSGINIEAIQEFKSNYNEGIPSIDALLRLEGNPSSDIFSNELNLINFFLWTRFRALTSANMGIYQILKTEKSNFLFRKHEANQKIIALKEGRLRHAVEMSLHKGFAGESINIFLNNIDHLLRKILREQVEESIFKRVISFVASLHPLGRLVALGYQVYQTMEDVEDTLDIVGQVFLIKEAMAMAENSTSVETTQRAAAELAWLSVNILPDLLGKLVEFGVKKVQKSWSNRDKSELSDKDDTLDDSKTTEASRNGSKKLSDSEYMDWDTLKKNPDLLNLEFEALKRAKPTLSKDSNYSIEAKIGNNHVWKKRKKDGGWCRFSKRDCLDDTDLRNYLDELTELEIEWLRKNDRELAEIQESKEKYEEAEKRGKEQRYEESPKRVKGKFGEREGDAWMENKGYTKVGGHDVDLPVKGSKVKPQGIDGVYKNSMPPPKWAIVEVKYDKSSYGHTNDGKQMSKTWIENKRLEEAVGTEKAAQIKAEGYVRWGIHVAPNGTVKKVEINW